MLTILICGLFWGLLLLWYNWQATEDSYAYNSRKLRAGDFLVGFFVGAIGGLFIAFLATLAGLNNLWGSPFPNKL